jgi:hypothetical protein
VLASRHASFFFSFSLARRTMALRRAGEDVNIREWLTIVCGWDGREA